jgi:uncharacterized protein
MNSVDLSGLGLSPARHPALWALRWQIGLQLVLLLFALVLGALGFRRALFLFFFVPVAFVPFSYARLRLQRSVESLCAPPLLLYTFCGLGMVFDAVMVAQLLTARSATPQPILHSVGISWVGAIWFSAHGLLFLWYLFLNGARASVRLLRGVVPARMFAAVPVPVSQFSIERRQFLRRAGVLGAGAPFVLSLSGVKLTYDFRVEEREITLPHWPRALDGLRVAHLSDIHVGGAMNRERLSQMAALTNAARPDLVLHTGDFLTHRSGDFDLPLYEALARIKAPYGQWACLGNHDFDAVARLVERLAQAGVITLRNALTTLSIQGHALEIGGIDYLFGRFGLDKDSYDRSVRSWGPRASVPRVLLLHDPRAFAALPQGCADLVLSGHTHGGQVGLQLGRDQALTVVGLFGIPDQGIFRRGDMRLFVTRCVGFYGYPLRLGIPPEIALLTLRAPRPRPTLV